MFLVKKELITALLPRILMAIRTGFPIYPCLPIY